MLPLVKFIKNNMPVVIILFNMGFWQKVDDELSYLGKSRKELALEANFDVSYISKGIERNGIPIADTAVRIAKALNVSLEYLLDMEKAEAIKINVEEIEKEDIRIYKKYKKILEHLEKIDQKERKAILTLIETLSERKS